MWTIPPVGAFDIPAIERWLERMAGKGWRFTSATGCIASFTREPPAQVHIHIEPALTAAGEEDRQLQALYEEAGWRFLGIWRDSFHVFAAKEETAPAHTDPETLDYLLRRFLRRRLIAGAGGMIGFFLLLRLYWSSSLTWNGLRYFPYLSMTGNHFLPFVLTAGAFALIAIAYLYGLWRLVRYRSRPGERSGDRFAAGWVGAIGTLLLLPVLWNTAYLFAGQSYDPYPLEGSGFVTLTEIEGEDLRLSGDPLYAMDRIAYSNTPLSPETWYFQQYASFRRGEGIPEDVKRIEIRITRYALPALAAGVTEEYIRIVDYDTGDWSEVAAAHGFDKVCVARGESSTRLLLRRGRLLVRVLYVGEKDLTEYLDSFDRMCSAL